MLFLRVWVFFTLTLALTGCGPHAEGDDPVSWFHPGEKARLKVRIENRSQETLHYSVSMYETLSENRCIPYQDKVENDLAPGQSGVIKLEFNCRYANVRRYITVTNSRGTIFNFDPEGSSFRLGCDLTECKIAEN